MTIFCFIPLLIYLHIGQCIIVEYLRDEKNLQIVYDDLMQFDFGIPKIDHLKKFAISPKNVEKMTRNNLLKQAIQARVKDLECGIKIMTLSVLLVTEIEMNYIEMLVKNKWSARPLVSMRYEYRFCQTANDMLRILFNLGLKNLLDIWMFAMFYCEAPYSFDAKAVPDLMKARDLIYQELKKSTMNCNVESIHDITDPQHLLHNRYTTLNSDSLINLSEVFVVKIDVCNEVINALSIYAESNIILRNSDKMYTHNLYLRKYHYLFSNDALGYLQTNYGHNIEWGNAINMIKTSMNEAIGVNKLLNRFESIKILHTQFLAQMNIIFFRLLATHILLICDKIANKRNEFMTEDGMQDFVLDANYKIKQKIILFTTLTGYYKNNYFNNLKNYFSSDVYTFCEQKYFQINTIKVQLKELCLMFGNECNATGTLEINSIDFDDLKKLYQNLVKNVLVEKPSLVGYEDEFIIVDNTYRLYKIVDTFVKHLSFILLNVDYNLINEMLSLFVND